MHAGEVTGEACRALQDRRFYNVPELYVLPDVTFDRWCYVDDYTRRNPDEADWYPRSDDGFPAVMQAVGAKSSMNWRIALYDADTGLLIYYEYDS